MIALSLTKGNRIRLARAFRGSKRVDIAIDCVVEGQMGNAFADDPENPTAFKIEVGPFCYFAGDARSTGGVEMIRDWSRSDSLRQKYLSRPWIMKRPMFMTVR